MNKDKAIEIIEHQKQRLYDLSDAIWDNPEVAYQETFAAKAYISALREFGFDVVENLTGIPTAFCGTYGQGKPVIGILGEFDALGGMSQISDLAECKAIEQGAAGHGCGHNLLGVGSFAAAISVKKYLEGGHKGTVKFFGCPAEEGGAGKGFLARDGAFNDLDVAFSWHPSDTTSVMTGSCMANQQILYHFTGKSSHAAIAPELGRSALDACELMNVGVQFLREHISSECRVHYAITNTGGNSPGVVQPIADVLYLMRAPSLSEVKDLRDRVDNIANGAALMTDTQVEIKFIKACSSVIPNKVLCKVLQKNMGAIGAPKFDESDYAYAKLFKDTSSAKDYYYESLVNAIPDEKLQAKLAEDIEAPLHGQILPLSTVSSCSPASSDVGDVSCVCPTAQISVTTMPAATAMHSWQEVAIGKSIMAKKGMLQAGRIIAAAAIDLFEDPSIIVQAQAEYNRHTGGIPFQSPIPPYIKPPFNEK